MSVVMTERERVWVKPIEKYGIIVDKNGSSVKVDTDPSNELRGKIEVQESDIRRLDDVPTKQIEMSRRKGRVY